MSATMTGVAERGEVHPNRRPTLETEAGRRIEYTVSEKVLAASLTIYLALGLLGALWAILDIWMGQFRLFQAPLVKELAYAVPAAQQPLLKLVLYGMAGGWLGGVIAAARSLQAHYTAPVEYVGDLERQERTRFHAAWWTRWFWGPWKGMGLSLIVIALVRSGVLVFAGLGTGNLEITQTESFATLGLGALIGLGSKDVIDKLILALKGWLKVEEPERPRLQITPSERQVASWGGAPLTFRVNPDIAVTWSMSTPDEVEAGTISNGVFRPARAPSGHVEEVWVVITATSKRDADRAVSTALLVKGDGEAGLPSNGHERAEVPATAGREV